MFRSLRVKRHPTKYASDVDSISAEQLQSDPSLPITLRQINHLPENARKRIYRALLPPSLLVRFAIDPVNWNGRERTARVELHAPEGSYSVTISLQKTDPEPREILRLELADNSQNGVDLNFILLADPDGPRFLIDRDEQGQATLFGTARRSLAEEEKAMRFGLAPGQASPGLRASQLVFDQLETFLAALGHRAYFLEPMTYASAWLFERRGFAYVRGHQLMDEIDSEFQPGGRLHQVLDNSTPFRRPDQWRSVRGRAWAIHDGVLQSIGKSWDALRMVKQVGRHAGVATFPNAVY